MNLLVVLSRVSNETPIVYRAAVASAVPHRNCVGCLPKKAQTRKIAGSSEKSQESSNHMHGANSGELFGILLPSSFVSSTIVIKESKVGTYLLILTGYSYLICYNFSSMS